MAYRVRQIPDMLTARNDTTTALGVVPPLRHVLTMLAGAAGAARSTAASDSR